MMLMLAHLALALPKPQASGSASASPTESAAAAEPTNPPLKPAAATPADAPSEPGATTKPTDFSKLRGYAPGGGEGRRIIEIPIEGTIDMGLASFVERVFEKLETRDIVLLKVKTLGGRVDAAVRIRDQLLAAKVPTVAFVDRRAISAGALISLSADTIFMSPGASIGAATPVEQGHGEMKPTSEKVVSYMRAEMRATAEAKGRRADLAEAMVDQDIEVEGVIKKGKLLTLTSSQAVRLGFADAQVSNLNEVLEKLNLRQASREPASVNWGEDLARFLTDPVISSLLMTFGFIGLLMELYSPGFGIGGVIGVVCLILFFGGHYAAKLAGWEEGLLILVGFGLLALEVFVIPGTTVVGLLGALLLCTGLVMAMIRIDLPLGVAFDLGYVQEAVWRALTRLAVTIIGLGVASALAFKFLPESRVGSWLVFKMQPAGAAPGALGAETRGGSLPEGFADLLGKQGVAHSVLRPTGVADFNGRRVDVLTEGEFVAAGLRIEVIRVDGHRILVRTVDNPSNDHEDGHNA
jgi:membrane-bound serine protease (ClpP class)